jgi:hypothetical protein
MEAGEQGKFWVPVVLAVKQEYRMREVPPMVRCLTTLLLEIPLLPSCWTGSSSRDRPPLTCPGPVHVQVRGVAGFSSQSVDASVAVILA